MTSTTTPNLTSDSVETLETLMRTADMDCYIRRFSQEGQTIGQAVQARDKNDKEWYVKHLVALKSDKKSIQFLIAFAVRICKFYGTQDLDAAIPKFKLDYETHVANSSTRALADHGAILEAAWASAFA